MTEVIFSFDTEDFTSKRNADAVLALAKLFTEEGVTAHFATVGLLASQLTAWGRDDVKEAMKDHIIGTHTYGHTLHPSVCELSDLDDYDEAHRLVVGNETKGIDLINESLGDPEIMYAVPPGNGDSYVGAYVYSEMGIPFYMDGCVHDSVNTLIDYCGSTRIPYFSSLEDLYFSGEYKSGKFLEEMAKRKRVVLYHHPNMSVKTKFWDALNYCKENKREFGDWIEAPDRPAEATEAFWAWIRTLIRDLKNDDRFMITDLHEIKKRLPDSFAPIGKESLISLCRETDGEVKPVGCYTAADLIYAASTLLRGESEYKPERKSVRGFLSEPIGVKETTTVSAEGIREAAKQIKTGEFIPHVIIAGDKEIGPADFLYAAADVLSGKSEAVITPKPQNVDMSDFTELNEFKLAGTWMHADSLKDEYLSDRLRLQSWTLRVNE